MQNIVPGTVLGSYTIIRLIGRGGMGEVYETNEQSLDRRVALKVIAREKIGSKGEGDIIRRFLQEARILAQVNHPNVVTIHAIDRYQETQFIAMEYIEGAPFHELFSFLAFSAEEAVPLFLQMLEGMRALHGKNILHRDLKPHNLMLRTDGQVKILDFGIAKRQGDNEPEDASKKLVGTLAYMAPEVVFGSRADIRSDMWSLGAIFYECLVGHPLVSAHGQALVGVRARPESDIVFPEESLSRIRPEMRVIIARLCDRNPDTRYASLTEAIEDLKRFQHDFPAPEGFAKSLCKIVEGIEVVKAGFDPKQIVESGDKRAFTLALLKEVSANFESARLAQMDSGYVTDSSELVRTTSDSVASRQKARRKSRKRNRSRLWPAVALVNASLLVLVVFWFGLRTPTHPEPAVVYKETAPLLVPINLVAPMNAQALWLQPNEPPTFTWSRGAAAGEFSLEVATDAEFKKVVLAANVEGTSYRPGQPFPEGAYYWRLSRSNGPTFEGPLKFSVNTVAPLDLIHPHSNSPLTVAPAEKQLAVEFSWVCKPGASSYIVQISHSPRFERIVKEGVLAMCSENWINLPAGQYYWRARMESPSIERYPWSAVAGFTIQRKTKTVPPSPAPAPAVAANPKPVLKKRSVEKPVIAEPVAVAAPKPVVLPAPRPLEIKQVFTLKFNESGMARDIASVRAQMTAPQLAWAPVEGASSYKVEISRTPDFTQKIFKGITKTSHLDWTAATPGRVFWRVTAVGATESASSYGCQLDVRLPAPALMSTYSDSPRGFEWETIPLAERYIVEWDHSRTMANKSQKLTKRAQTQFDMSQGSVFVRVATANRKGERTSEFSRIARIVTLP